MLSVSSQSFKVQSGAVSREMTHPQDKDVKWACSKVYRNREKKNYSDPKSDSKVPPVDPKVT